MARHLVGKHQDPWHIASTKLAQDWSASRGVPHITPEFLQQLLPDERFAAMDAGVKRRLLLAGLLALDAVPATPPGTAAADVPEAQRAAQATLRDGVHGFLQQLQAAVGADADEWSKVMAAAAGQLDGRLDLQAVAERLGPVRDSMEKLEGLVQQSNNADLMPPLEELFLQQAPSVLRPDARHFVVRQNPEVKPLSEQFSYIQATATPEPPGLQAHGGGNGGRMPSPAPASMRPAQQQQQQVVTPRAAAAAAGSNGGGLGRVKAAAHLGPERQHSVQVLDAQEQANLFKNTTKRHGHGVASSVRHEQRAVIEKPVQRAKPPQDQPSGPQPRRPPAAAAAAGGEELDALFEDSEDEDDFIDDAGGADARAPQAAAAAGPGRGAAGTLRRQGQQQGGWDERGRHERTPEDVVDELDEGEGGDDLGGSARRQQQRQPPPPPQQQRQQQPRRQQLVEDEDEDDDDMDIGEAPQQQRVVAAGDQAGRGRGRPQAPPAAARGLPGTGSGGGSATKRRRHIIDDDSEDDD